MEQKELFERFQILEVMVRGAAGVVQNPLEQLGERDKEYFVNTMDEIKVELESLKEDVLEYYGEGRS